MAFAMDSDGDSSPSSLHPGSGSADGTIPDERERRLSRGLVEFYKNLHGRGPIAARTLLSPVLALTVMHEILTPGEQTLVGGGKLLGVEQMRLRTAEFVRPQLIELAEDVLEEEVTASVTGIGVLENIVTETFFLASAPGR